MSTLFDHDPYVDYEFYKNEYLGTSITSKESFDKALIEATAFIDRITFHRIQRLESIPNCVKLAVCAVTEKMYAFSKKEERDISSESNDGYSVSYKDSGSRKDMEADALNIAKMYLSGTGLLYRGRSRIYDN